MPLIILSGYPCSGKSTRARQLHEYFVKEHPNRSVPTSTSANNSPTALKCVHVIDDDYLRVGYNFYDTPSMEKKARAAMLSAVERLLAKDHLVIADGMNYIKGLRYQLYCIARAIGTPHCVVRSYFERWKVSPYTQMLIGI
jgi:protein KTI12